MVSAVSVSLELFLSTENITFKISEISFQNISKLSDPSISRRSPNNYPAETCINNAELTDFIQHFKFWSKPESLCVKIVILDRFENATVTSESLNLERIFSREMRFGPVILVPEIIGSRNGERNHSTEPPDELKYFQMIPDNDPCPLWGSKNAIPVPAQNE